MFVYEIQNKVDGKRYIGQTTNGDVTHRWKAHISELNNQRHVNAHLQSAWNKFGALNFSFHVLEVCSDEFSLNEREFWWIDKYQSHNRKFGYNFVHRNSSNHWMGRLARSKALRHEGYENVVDPTGVVYEIKNLREFCRIHNLTQYGFRQVVVTRKYFHYKGWRLATSDTIGLPFEDTNLQLRGDRISQRKRGVRYPDVISPSGSIYTVENLSKFCREHGLSKSNLSMLLRGKKHNYKGWKVAH